MLDKPHEISEYSTNITKKMYQLYTLRSTEISDALDACRIEGALLGIKPLLRGNRLIGPAYTVRYLPYEQTPTTFQGAANYIDQVPPQSIIVIDNQGHRECSVWGDLLTQVAVKKDIAGTVVYGAVRDVEAIRALRYPVYSTDYCMRSGKNRVYKASQQETLIIQGISIHPGDIIFADDNGVLVIPLHRVDEVIEKAKNIQRTEEKISAAVSMGSTLQQARLDFHYDRPWLMHTNCLNASKISDSDDE